MAIKTLNTLLSLIPKDNKGGGDKGDDTNRKGDDTDMGNDTNGEKGEKGDTTEKGDPNGEKGDSTEKGESVGGDEEPTTMEDFKDIAGQIAEELMNGGNGGLKDKDDAVTEVVAEEKEKVLKEDVQVGEAPYNPASTKDDKVRLVKDNSYNGTPMNERVLESAASLTAPIRSGLQRLVRGLETVSVRHGTRTGRSLSERRYAQTWGSIKSGTKVKRAYKRKSDRLDTSIACSIVVDQSGSMRDKLVATQMGMIALAQSISDIGGQVEVIGYTTGRGQHRKTDHSQHRSASVDIDVFMEYGDRFHAVKDRFGLVKAKNLTPTADGIQYGLEGLSVRKEAHRVMFVLTDGEPDRGHRPVIKRQIRLAKEAGITIIGVGLGAGTQNVASEYDVSVYAPNMGELPRLLLEKLSDVFDYSENKRGTKIKAS